MGPRLLFTCSMKTENKGRCTKKQHKNRRDYIHGYCGMCDKAQPIVRTTLQHYRNISLVWKSYTQTRGFCLLWYWEGCLIHHARVGMGVNCCNRRNIWLCCVLLCGIHQGHNHGHAHFPLSHLCQSLIEICNLNMTPGSEPNSLYISWECNLSHWKYDAHHNAVQW
jgi:hypothetical protein